MYIGLIVYFINRIFCNLPLGRQSRCKATRAINEAKEARKVNELLVGETMQGGGDGQRERIQRACKEPLQQEKRPRPTVSKKNNLALQQRILVVV